MHYRYHTYSLFTVAYSQLVWRFLSQNNDRTKSKVINSYPSCYDFCQCRYLLQSKCIIFLVRDPAAKRGICLSVVCLLQL